MGEELTPDNRAVRRHIGIVPQDLALYADLSARENLSFFGRLYGLRGSVLRQRVDETLAAVALTDRAGDRVGTFSGGMRRRLNIAAALMHEPPVLLLDEPTAALDSASRDMLFGLLTSLREQGRAIVLTTHHVDEAEHWCDRVGVLRKGRLTSLGRPVPPMKRRCNNPPTPRPSSWRHSASAPLSSAVNSMGSGETG